MTRFSSLFKRTGATNLLRQFGEDVTYYQRDSSFGVVRKAIVTRDSLRIYQELGQQVGPAVIVQFLNDIHTGILAEQINPENDQIDVALECGLSVSRRQVTQLMSSANGWTRVLVK
jgi:hypothetical protein